jgi:hypothetical protein
MMPVFVELADLSACSEKFQPIAICWNVAAGSNDALGIRRHRVTGQSWRGQHAAIDSPQAHGSSCSSTIMIDCLTAGAQITTQIDRGSTRANARPAAQKRRCEAPGLVAHEFDSKLAETIGSEFKVGHQWPRPDLLTSCVSVAEFNQCANRRVASSNPIGCDTGATVIPLKTNGDRLADGLLTKLRAQQCENSSPNPDGGVGLNGPIERMIRLLCYRSTTGTLPYSADQIGAD